MSIYGKALVTVTRLTNTAWGDKDYDLSVHIQSTTGPGEYILDAAHEELHSSMPIPTAANRLGVGDSVTLTLGYVISYHYDYYGDADVLVEIDTERVLHRSRYGRNRKQRKQIQRTKESNHAAVPF